jgi:hypothetical protein
MWQLALWQAQVVLDLGAGTGFQRVPTPPGRRILISSLRRWWDGPWPPGR